MTQFIITTIILSLTLIANAALLSLVYSRKNHTALARILSLHITSIICWAFFILLLSWLPKITGIYEYSAGSIGYNVEKLIFFSAVILFSTNYWFVLYFTQRLKQKLFNVLILMFQMGIGILTLLDNVFYTTLTVAPEGYVFLAITPLNSIFALFLLFHLITPPLLLIQGYRSEVDTLRQRQYRTLLGAYCAFLVLSILFNWVLPVYFAIFTFNAFGPTMSLILVVAFAYTITRHHFLEINHIVQRSTIYVALLAGIIALYSALVYIVGFVFGTLSEITILISAGITTCIGSFSIPLLDQYLRRVTAPLFFRQSYIEERVQERTAEIQRLQQEQEAMMLNISHSLQTPLTILQGHLYFIRDQLETETIQTFERTIASIGEYIHNLLRLAQLESTQGQHIDPLPCDISVIVSNICRSFKDMGAENVSISCAVKEELVVSGLSDDLSEIVRNIIGNAVKYSEKERHNAINVSLEKVGHNAQLTIKDTGIGIKKEHLDHIFTRFYRIKDENKHGSKGSGIGLAITKQLVRRNNGDVSVESTLGIGTTFTLTFPLA